MTPVKSLVPATISHIEINSLRMSPESNSTQLSLGPVLDLFQALSPLANDISEINTPLVSSPVQDVGNISPRSSHLGNFRPVWRYLDNCLKIGASRVDDDILGEEGTLCNSLSAPDTLPHDDEPYNEPDDKLDDDTQDLEKLAKAEEVKSKDEAVHLYHNVRAPSRYGTVVDATDDEGPDLPTLKYLLALEDPIAVQGMKLISKPEYSAKGHLRWSKDDSFGSEAELPSVGLKRAKRVRSSGQISNKHIVKISSSGTLPSARSLKPAWVTPMFSAPVSLSPIPAPTVPLWPGPVVINPILTREEKLSRLIKGLVHKFGDELGSLLSVDPLSITLLSSGNVSPNGIHVFVDNSNITIGFYDAIKISRHLSPRALSNRIPFSFHSLALIMERGRPAAKRVLVGSNQGSRLPDYIKVAKECGYEVSILERVEKVRPIHQRGSTSHGTSGQSSGSETPFFGITKVTEQGVDEILHMKMLESIVDYRPNTMVLATGDAAEAEYSGGFLVMVERALERGWRVELVAWTKSMSNAWLSEEFTERWRDRFRLINLDDYCEELFGMSIKEGQDVVPGSSFADPNACQ